MSETIRESYVHARKCYKCDYCGGLIKKGEKHHYAFLKNGDVYDWRSHLECKFIAQELYEYIDPWDGMTCDDFIEGVDEFCQNFICPKCKAYDKETEECADDERYCLFKVAELLKEYELIYTGNRDIWHRYYKLEPRKIPVTKYQGAD